MLPITRRGVITQPRGILRITQNGVIALTTAGSAALKSSQENWRQLCEQIRRASRLRGALRALLHINGGAT